MSGAGRVLLGQSDGPATARRHLVDVVDHHHLVARRGDEHHRVAVVHGRQGPVLEFAAENLRFISVAAEGSFGYAHHQRRQNAMPNLYGFPEL